MRNLICALILLNSVSCSGYFGGDTIKVIARHIASVDIGEERSSTFKVIKQLYGNTIPDTLIVFSLLDVQKLQNTKEVILELVERIDESGNAERLAFVGFELVQAMINVEVITLLYDEWDHCYQTPTEKKTRTILRNTKSDLMYLIAPCSNTGTVLQLFVYGYNIAISENTVGGLECPPILDLTDTHDGWYFATLGAEGICLTIDLVIETKAE